MSNRQLAEKVRMSIQEVDQVLKLNPFSQTARSVSTMDKARRKLSSPKPIEEDPCLTPSPRASFKKFRELLKTNNLVVDDSAQTPKVESKTIQEPLTGSKMSYKTNCESESKEDYFKPRICMSPNLRYKQNEHIIAGSSQENKIIITDEFKISN